VIKVPKLSIVIPSYSDPLLYKTVDSLLQSAVEDVEIIPVLDGWETKLPTDPRVKPILLKENKGMRGAINAGLLVATGEFVMKSDSHCLFAPGFDKVMVESCLDNWLMIPSRYSLDDGKWERNFNRPVYNYHYLAFPKESKYGCGLFPLPWSRKDLAELIDDTMTMQGSCWFANRKYFMEHVGYLDDRLETYSSFADEPLEVGLKYWLGGGEMKVNKNTWYAHLKKARHHYDQKIYQVNYKKKPHVVASHTWAGKHWMNDEEPNMIHKFEWLVEKFWPIPTWEDNWREIWLNSQ
jgi:glycosyltransferase involved in cell wall biosynthesis